MYGVVSLQIHLCRRELATRLRGRERVLWSFGPFVLSTANALRRRSAPPTRPARRGPARPPRAGGSPVHRQPVLFFRRGPAPSNSPQWMAIVSPLPPTTHRHAAPHRHHRAAGRALGPTQFHRRRSLEVMASAAPTNHGKTSGGNEERRPASGVLKTLVFCAVHRPLIRYSLFLSRLAASVSGLSTCNTLQPILAEHSRNPLPSEFFSSLSGILSAYPGPATPPEFFPRKSVVTLAGTRPFASSFPRPPAACLFFHPVPQAENDFGLYGVFDGHGARGHDVSNFVKENLPKLIISEKSFRTEPEKIFKDGFLRVQKMIEVANKKGLLNAQLSGCTCTVVLHDIVKDRLYVSHVGDSRAILVRKDIQKQT